MQQKLLDWLDNEEALLTQELRATVYSLVDLRIATGKYKPEEREQRFVELWAMVERRIDMELTGSETLQ